MTGRCGLPAEALALAGIVVNRRRQRGAADSPPVLDVIPGKLATRDDKVKVEGFATDSDRVLDVYIFVGSRKVFYQSNRKANDPKRLNFATLAGLKPGVNVIAVVARENEDSATQQRIIVRRDGPNGEPLPTPKSELFGEDWDFQETGDD